jgi:hypothetical protein
VSPKNVDNFCSKWQKVRSDRCFAFFEVVDNSLKNVDNFQKNVDNLVGSVDNFFGVIADSGSRSMH